MLTAALVFTVTSLKHFFSALLVLRKNQLYRDQITSVISDY